jgi:hypothetical protein
LGKNILDRKACAERLETTPICRGGFSEPPSAFATYAPLIQRSCKGKSAHPSIADLQHRSLARWNIIDPMSQENARPCVFEPAREPEIPSYKRPRFDQVAALTAHFGDRDRSFRSIVTGDC